LSTKILLEGRPGIGKTTVARRLADMLVGEGRRVSGFVTEEIREGRRRAGFAVETFDGRRATLAHVTFPGPPRVSRYGVDLEAFERLALPALEEVSKGSVAVVDELGKMELASERFKEVVAELFDAQPAIVATIQLARNPFTDALKRRRDTELVRVTEGNRDELPSRLADRLRS
jgi:nucleoside-triphosphatase